MRERETDRQRDRDRERAREREREREREVGRGGDGEIERMCHPEIETQQVQREITRALLEPTSLNRALIVIEPY